MPELLQHGQKIEYLYEGKWRKGVIHGVRTYEEPNGVILRLSYLIDTGKTIREDDGVNAKTGKPEKVRQPEQVEVDQQFVRTEDGK